MPFSLVFSLLPWPKPLEVVAPTVLDRLADRMVSVAAAVLVPQANDATEEHASVIVVALASNVAQTDVEPLVETAFLDKLVSQENVLELVLLNVFVQMEQ